MKKFLFILTILCGIFFCSQQQENNTCTLQDIVTNSCTEELIDKDDMTDVDNLVLIISQDLKSCNGLMPRRTAASVNSLVNPREVKTEIRTNEHFRILGMNLQKRISEKVTICRIINFSTLLCRNKYPVFGLRKLII